MIPGVSDTKVHGPDQEVWSQIHPGAKDISLQTWFTAASSGRELIGKKWEGVGFGSERSEKDILGKGQAGGRHRLRSLSSLPRAVCLREVGKGGGT